jgi:hypothetical protein
VLIGTGRKKLPGTKRSSLFYEQNVGQFRCGGQLRIFLQEFSRLSRTTARKPHATRSTTSSSPRFRAAARRRYGCAVGRSLYDAPGPGFTLLRTDPAVETGSLLAAAAQRGVPMVVLDAGFRTNVWRLRFPRSSRNRRMVPQICAASPHQKTRRSRKRSEIMQGPVAVFLCENLKRKG